MTEPIDLTARVSVAADVVFRDVEGETVLLNLRSGVYFTLDEIGSRIWRLVAERRPLGDIVTAVVEEYDVSPPACAADLLAFVALARDKGLLEVGDVAAP